MGDLLAFKHKAGDRFQFWQAVTIAQKSWGFLCNVLIRLPSKLRVLPTSGLHFNMSTFLHCTVLLLFPSITTVCAKTYWCSQISQESQEWYQVILPSCRPTGDHSPFDHHGPKLFPDWRRNGTWVGRLIRHFSRKRAAASLTVHRSSSKQLKNRANCCDALCPALSIL